MTENDHPRPTISISEAAIRDAFSLFASGVAVVTARNEQGEARGITVTSFTSVSLDPPLVLFCLDKTAFHVEVFSKAKAFAINVLRADQDILSNRFAMTTEDNLDDLTITKLHTDSPILDDCLSALDCTTEARHDAGDHLIIIGRIQALAIDEKKPPLLYFRRNYRAVTPSGDG